MRTTSIDLIFRNGLRRQDRIFYAIDPAVSDTRASNSYLRLKRDARVY